ncbi:transcriptional activator Mta [Sphingomonas limnosediminicola]|uniref:Transcriptional activator Mta n=1 Tax=Sphingomonas limnosediminicola TaxID=940133 RepID=A0ABP7LPV8_9SPHN
MEQPLDIRDVARRTGLSSRALRFYEARGLLKPLRTHTGRRIYGRGELERLQQIVALKRAGLSLAQIGKLTARGSMDFAAVIQTQLEIIEKRKQELEEAKALLLNVKSRIDRGEPVDAETFCSLISQGEKIMQPQDWKKVTDRYFSEDEKAHWAKHPPATPEGFDQAEYAAKWKDIGDRVQAAIPSGPDSPKAQALYDEWQQLLAPFKATATPEMMSGATRFYERMDEWHGDAPQAPFTPEAFRFIQEVGRRRAST